MLKLTTASLDYGYVSGVRQIMSPHYNDRPENAVPTLLVIHNISLPPKQYGGPYIEQLFTKTLDLEADPYFQSLSDLKVSCHFLIRRDGEVIQFVSCDKNAWHAGISEFEGQSDCNDFSIGIEIEGSDEEEFEQIQYDVLVQLTLLLSRCYPIRDIVGHDDIAPGRKTDPGPYFDWSHYSALLRDPKHE